MKKIKLIWAFFCLFIVSLIFISIYPAIPRPDKMIVHRMNDSVVISKNDRLYNEIFSLTNKRFTLRNVQSNIGNEEKEAFMKDSMESVEFIYNEPQSYRSKKGFLHSITYNRLLFPIEASNKIESTYVFFGSEKGYYNVTVKDLLTSNEIANTLKHIK